MSAKQLYVEGATEKRVLPELLEINGVAWSPIPVSIKDMQGVENILDRATLSAGLKSPRLEVLGLIVDADEDSGSRWQQLASIIPIEYAPPARIPAAGAIMRVPNKPTLGVWIMPDNESLGMLESLLCSIRELDDNQDLVSHIDNTIEIAQTKGARYRNVHLDKARVYTWLAWQDPPGEQLHSAVRSRFFKNRTPALERFVAWFNELYSLGTVG